MNNQSFPNMMAAASRGNAQQYLIRHYRAQQPKAPGGWQQAVPPEERATIALQFFTSYRLMKSDLSEPDALRMSITLETQTFMSSQTKELYTSQLRARLTAMTTTRQQQLQGQQLQGLQPNANNPMNPMNAAQMGMLGQPGMQGPRPNNPQQLPQGFPNAQLGRPMQASPIPMTQGQSSMGMNGASIANGGQVPNNQQPGMQPGQQPQQNNALINRLAQRLMETAQDNVRQQFQQEVNSWPEEKRQQLIQRGINPIFLRFRAQAENLLKNNKIPQNQLQALQGLTQGNQLGGAMQQPNQMNQMQNQQMGMNQRQPNQEFDFSALANQQSEAIRVQDQGQQVVPASNNPMGGQMVGFPGQNAQPGQPQNAAMAQRQAAQVAAFQRQAAQQARAQQLQQQQQQQHQQQQQQQQAQAQQRPAQMLQGQLGLNLPPGTQQSPAMPMLTRPMVPPGQAAPTTPQQRPQSHVPQMTPQNQNQVDPQLATQLMREAQQRAAVAAGAQGQPLTEQVRLSMIPADLDPMVKAQLLKVPEAQFRTILGNYMTSLRRTNAMQPGPFPTGQPTPGQSNMMLNPGGLQIPGMSGPMMNGANMGIMRPGMNLGQPTPGPMGAQPPQMNQRQGALPPQARLLQAQQLLQASPGIISMTDGKPFPPTVLNAQLRQSLPPDIKTWAQLKQWAGQNPSLLPGVDSNKLLLLQVLHFQDMMRHQQAQQQLQQQNGMAGGRPPQQGNMGAIAPPAQMTPGSLPARTPQQQQPTMALGAMQITQQELQAFRARLPPGQVPPSDDQLRNFIYQHKMGLKKPQGAMNLQAAQRAQAQQPSATMSGPGPQVTRPPVTQPQPAQLSTPQPKPASQPQQPSQQPPPAQSAATNTLKQGQKRPNEDSAEAGMEGPSSTGAPQAPAMVPSRSVQGLNLTKEQMSNLNPQVRERLKHAQDISTNKAQPRPSNEELQARMKDPEREKKYKLMISQENQKLPQGQPVQISPEVRSQLQALIREKLPIIRKVESALRLFLASYEGGDSENVARTIIRARIALLRQLNPADGSLQPQITMTEEEFRANVRNILNFVGRMMARMQSNAAPKTQPQPPVSQPQGQPPQPSQLNAANLQKLENQHRQPKPPPAPIDAQPPFQLGAASPAGTPIYAGGAKNFNLNFPPEKKRAKFEHASQTPTPGSKPSPRNAPGSKGSSPDLKRQPAPEKPMAQRPTFKCKTADCEYAVRGFDTQAELEAHISQAHARIDDPMQFVIDSMADFLGVDSKSGQARPDPAVANRISRAAPTAARVPSQTSKPGQTPSIPQTAATPVGPQAAATPMTRVPTQPGIKSSPSANLLKTPQTSGKVATPSTGAPAKATPSSIVKPAPKEPEVPAAEPEKEEELQPLIPTSLFDFSYDDIYSVLDANAPLTTLDFKDEDNAWALRSRPSSPLDTPDSSSKDTPSTRQSDISENDNLQININLKDADMPDAWLAALNGDALPIDTQLSEDLQSLGVTLPPMDHDDMMLFYPDSAMMDLDTLDKTMDSLGGTLDPSMLSAAG